jgi:hypothetical protein
LQSALRQARQALNEKAGHARPFHMFFKGLEFDFEPPESSHQIVAEVVADVGARHIAVLARQKAPEWRSSDADRPGQP